MRPLYEEGRVQRGAKLIVESFDRLSCAEPIDALGIFTDVIQSRLNLAILTDPPKVFNRAFIKANTFQLFEALLDMRRAQEESKRKGDLVCSAWKERKQRVASEVSGTKEERSIDVRFRSGTERRIEVGERRGITRNL